MKRKINSFSFLGVAVRHHKALAKLKQQNQKKIHCTKSLQNRITLQTTSRTCLGRFHSSYRSTMDIQTMLVFEALRIKKIKTNKIKFGMM